MNYQRITQRGWPPGETRWGNPTPAPPFAIPPSLIPGRRKPANPDLAAAAQN